MLTNLWHDSEPKILISKLLIKMKFDSQHTRKTANQFLEIAYTGLSTAL